MKNNDLTDFEKLLFAISHIKELHKEIIDLKIEKGKMQSDIDEFTFYIHKKENPKEVKLHKYKQHIKELSLKCRNLKIEHQKTKSELLALRTETLKTNLK